MSHFIYCYAQCHYDECRYAQCHYDECRYAQCRYAECRSASPMTGLVRQATRHLPAMVKCTIGGS